MAEKLEFIFLKSVKFLSNLNLTHRTIKNILETRALTFRTEVPKFRKKIPANPGKCYPEFLSAQLDAAVEQRSCMMSVKSFIFYQDTTQSWKVSSLTWSCCQ